LAARRSTRSSAKWTAIFNGRRLVEPREGEEVTEFLNKINPYLTTLTFFLAAIYNAMVMYFDYAKTPGWKLIGSILTVIILLIVGTVRLRSQLQ